MKDVLVGVDAGTSVVKSIAFDLEGRQLAVAATPNRYQTRPDGAAVLASTASSRLLRLQGERKSPQ